MKREKRLALLEKANRELGRELVAGQKIPEVWGCGIAWIDKKPGLQLKLMCSEAAKARVIAEYGTHHQGFKLHFDIVGGPPVFLSQTAKVEVGV